MDHPIKNNQKFIAAQFCLSDIQVNKYSHHAVLITKRWKLIKKIPAPIVGEIMQAHTERLITKSFFSYIPNQLLLIEEGYFHHLEN